MPIAFPRSWLAAARYLGAAFVLLGLLFAVPAAIVCHMAHRNEIGEAFDLWILLAAVVGALLFRGTAGR